MAKIHTPIPVLKLNDGTGIPMVSSMSDMDPFKDLIEHITSMYTE